MKNPRDVIVAPIVSEKSYDLIEQRGTYTFQVDPRSNKSEIRNAVEVIFGVKVSRVNIINRKGKRKRTGFVIGKRNDTKRALVTLAQGNEIDIFGVK
ncbi:MAG TPA: 50S ribosomal protein L23 [Acidimicrobiia bacterium]|uniref:Large ribosomal subunit protein uL23 n=1 Tax=uncultured actinobacterium Rifle_16ft_4_minimus_2010 TaxID=1665146 RepID=A0A0H4TM31_9ACTN|nr:50S ribosomal protein L25/L23, large subunit ribosomal protein L23 [uncultured actinobacterium Rifle_16ft_4_minimus_2010]HLE38523.1 50S ribosomal protein L23 [Acidimicrobiia bacterium]